MIKAAYIFALSVVLGACGGGTASRLSSIRGDYANGDFAAVENNTADESGTLDALISADAMFQGGKFAESDNKFEYVNRRMTELMSFSISDEAAKALSSQMAADYKPYMMDNLFVSYYQAWDALADNRANDARVIINQSYKKQRDMSEEFDKLIKSRSGGPLAAKLQSENSQWGAYKDIMNPALTYLAGIYFMNFAEDSADYDSARVYLSRASGMMPKNQYIKKDLDIAKSGRPPSGVAWIFIESGFAPKLRESRMDWPMFFGNKIQTVSFAISEPVISGPAPVIDKSELVADVDAMFMTEYGEYRINESLRALGSTAAKGVIQGVAGNRGGFLWGVAANVYSIASTRAEIRTWATLPKQIHVIRIDKKSLGNKPLIELKSDGKIVSRINVAAEGNDLVYLRFFGRGAEPKLIKLK